MWIRIGQGHNMYWKYCRWFEYNKRKGIDNRQEALEYYSKHGGPIMLSSGGRKYYEIKPEQIMKL